MTEPLMADALTYSVAQAAERLNVSESWLRREVAAGKVQIVRFGRAIRFTEGQLAGIIAANTVTPGSDKATVPTISRRRARL